MIGSMTGYGRGEARNSRVSVAVEIKTVNHRHLEASLRLPAGLWELESAIKKQLHAALRRGRVEVFLQLLSPLAGTREGVVDLDLARKYIKALRSAGSRLGVKGAPDLALLAGLPDVVRVEERPVPAVLIRPLVEKALGQALTRLLLMRRAEGRKLAQDIRRRLGTIGRVAQQVKQRFGRSARRQAQALRGKLREWMKPDSAESKRFIQDAVSRYVRADITEELVRLHAHLSQFSEFLGRREPVGRRLDFLTQEMHREINTLGAKASDAGVAHLVVTLKEEVEKIREQVQNVE